MGRMTGPGTGRTGLTTGVGLPTGRGMTTGPGVTNGPGLTTGPGGGTTGTTFTTTRAGPLWVPASSITTSVKTWSPTASPGSTMTLGWVVMTGCPATKAVTGQLIRVHTNWTILPGGISVLAEPSRVKDWPEVTWAGARMTAVGTTLSLMTI